MLTGPRHAKRVEVPGLSRQIVLWRSTGALPATGATGATGAAGATVEPADHADKSCGGSRTSVHAVRPAFRSCWHQSPSTSLKHIKQASRKHLASISQASRNHVAGPEQILNRQAGRH